MLTRTDWVDYAKAIGILLVVYGHVARGLYNAGINIPVDLYVVTDSVIYSFHMPLFFFLSGLFFINSFQKVGRGKLILSKIDTVFYPFILWSVLQGSIEAFLAGYTNGTVTYAEVFSLLWAPRAQFWFLYALFLVFVLASVTYSAVTQRATLAVFAYSLLMYLVQELLPANFVVQFLANNFVFFMFGIVFTQYFSADYFSKFCVMISLAGAFIFSQVIFHDVLVLTFLNKGLPSLLVALIGVAFVVSLACWAAQRPSKSIIYIGTSSMAIYLMHILAGSGARIVLGKVMGVDSYVLHLLAGCVAGLLGPIIALEIIKKLKIPFVFSAPISVALINTFNKLNPLHPARRTILPINVGAAAVIPDLLPAEPIKLDGEFPVDDDKVEGRP